MSKQPTAFFDNERVSHQALVTGQREATLERIARQGEASVLLVQDTTDFDFKQHPAAEGMGPLDNEYTWGFKAHSTLAVSVKGVPLGLFEQEIWARDPETTGKRHQRHDLPIEDKESYKWIKALPQMPLDARLEQVIAVADREADIYEFLNEALGYNVEFIVRARHDRKLATEDQKLFAHVRQMPLAAQYMLELPRRPGREAREAQVELRYATVTIQAPQRAQTEQQTITLQVIEVYEPHPPAGQEALHWVLLTSLPVASLEQAQQIIQWYCYRWLIERFHYVLKSGCRIEERQLREEKRLERLLGVFNYVAWRLLWLTYQAREEPEASCLAALEPEEWQALYAHTHRTTEIPSTPPTLHEAVRWIAKLGGFLGRKGDGDPGVKVLWRGWQRLQDIVTTWTLTHPPPQDVGNA